MKLLEIEHKTDLILKKVLKEVEIQLKSRLKNLKIKTPLQVSTVCVTGRKMKSINLKFRKKNKDTDVLSFPTPEVFRRVGVIGDLIFSKDKLIHQSEEQKHSIDTEMTILCIHGVLHLLDYDHEKSLKDEKIMRVLEEKILSSLLKKKAVKSLIGRT